MIRTIHFSLCAVTYSSEKEKMCIPAYFVACDISCTVKRNALINVGKSSVPLDNT